MIEYKKFAYLPHLKFFNIFQFIFFIFKFY